VPSRQYADGRPMQQRRRPTSNDNITSAELPVTKRAAATKIDSDETIGRRERECPVPKPAGLLGRILGFNHQDRPERLPVVVENSKSPQRHNTTEGG
jgi:hypothetical protein